MDSSQSTVGTPVSGGGGNSIIMSQSTDASPVDSTATASTPTTDESKQNLNQVINSIQKTLGILHQLYLTVSSFNAASQLPLLQRLYYMLSDSVSSLFLLLLFFRFILMLYLPFSIFRNNLVLELDNMSKLAEKCNIQVPMEVINLIDDGKNPDEFTRDVLNGCIAKNQITKGKTDAFKGFRGHLIEELEQTFPDEVEAYRNIRAASAAESKRLAQAQSMLPNGDVKVKTEM